MWITTEPKFDHEIALCRREKAVFLDTGFAIALAAPRDRYHTKAVQLADDLKISGAAIITTVLAANLVADALQSALDPRTA